MNFALRSKPKNLTLCQGGWTIPWMPSIGVPNVYYVYECVEWCIEWMEHYSVAWLRRVAVMKHPWVGCLAWRPVCPGVPHLNFLISPAMVPISTYSHWVSLRYPCLIYHKYIDMPIRTTPPAQPWPIPSPGRYELVPHFITGGFKGRFKDEGFINENIDVSRRPEGIFVIRTLTSTQTRASQTNCLMDEPEVRASAGTDGFIVCGWWASEFET